MIDEGHFEDVKKIIESLDDSNKIKHVLALTLVLTENENPDLKEAESLYKKYFKSEGAEIPLEDVSVGGHKAIGHLLSLQGKYNESIKHFEYAGEKIQSEQEKSMVHSSLGNDYEALGNNDKALEEYKKALETLPDSFELHYNIGCCLFDEQDYTEAMKYFEKFLELIKKDFNLKQ